MSLTDYAEDFAVESSVPYLQGEGPSMEAIEAKAEKLMSTWNTISNISHGVCCGTRHLNMLVGFFRKSGFQVTTPDTARAVTVIVTTLSSYANWWNTMSNNGTFKYGFSITEHDLITEMMPVVEGSMTGEWGDRLRWTQHSIPSVGIKGKTLQLPQGVLLTPSGNYCQTTNPRTLPVEYIGTIQAATRVGTVPPALSSDLSEGYSMVADETLSPLKNHGQGTSLHVTKIRAPFDVDAVVRQLKELM